MCIHSGHWRRGEEGRGRKMIITAYHIYRSYDLSSIYPSGLSLKQNERQRKLYMLKPPRRRNTTPFVQCLPGKTP